MPPHLCSELASQPKSTNFHFVCCDHLGPKMTKTLPLEASKSPPAGGPDYTAMPPGRVANLMMHWVKKWFRLWQNFPGALMKAILMGIAKGVCRLAAVAPLEKARRPLGEKQELGKDDDGEMLDCEVYHPGYFILSSLESWSQEHVESLIEDGQFEECLEQFSSVAKMGKMDLEDNTALRLIHRSMTFDFEEESESSSDDDTGLKDVTFLQKSMGGLGIGRYSEEKGEDSCNPHEEFEVFENDLEVDSEQRLASPSSSQEHGESVEPNGDFVAFEEQDMERTSDVSKVAENLLRFGNVKENMGAPAASCGFKSSLVLSLFYSPSEEEDDDDSEDWSSEDEIGETSQSCLDGTLLENGASSAAEGHSQHQGFSENLCGSCFSNVDPLPSLRFSKSIQPAAVASPDPKNHKEIADSFYIRQEDSGLEEFCDLPKSSKDYRSATGHPPLSSCQLGTERNCDLVTTETSFDSRKEHQTVKKVRFSSKITVHTLVVWDYASRAARRGPWEEMARDRCRFQRRIAEVGAILKPCLEVEHRAKAWEKIHGALDHVP